jgi:hypothetical protein
MKLMQPQANLFHIVDARAPSGRLSRLLHCWEEQPHERADDRDHDQEFDERKALACLQPAHDTLLLALDASTIRE